MAANTNRRSERTQPMQKKKKSKKIGRGKASVTTLADERYRAFIESIEDGIYEVDLEGNFTYFNNAL